MSDTTYTPGAGDGGSPGVSGSRTGEGRTDKVASRTSGYCWSGSTSWTYSSTTPHSSSCHYGVGRGRDHSSTVLSTLPWVVRPPRVSHVPPHDQSLADLTDGPTGTGEFYPFRGPSLDPHFRHGSDVDTPFFRPPPRLPNHSCPSSSFRKKVNCLDRGQHIPIYCGVSEIHSLLRSPQSFHL